MVRAAGLQTNPSGSYFNPSHGVFVTVSVNGTTVQPIQLAVARLGNDVELSWNSQMGMSYHVEGTRDLNAGPWVNLSGNMNGTGGTMRWTDGNAHLYGAGFYRVSNP